MGACHQACIDVLDQCPCPGADACEVDEAQKWKAAGCTLKCQAIRLWYAECSKGRGSSCTERGRKRWPDCNITYCTIGPEPGAKR